MKISYLIMDSRKANPILHIAVLVPAGGKEQKANTQ